MSDKWTAGPWKFYRDAQLLVSVTGERVAEINCHLLKGLDHDQCATNARLIAAAPAMVALLRTLTTTTGKQWAEAHAQAEQLLKDLEG